LSAFALCQRHGGFLHAQKLPEQTPPLHGHCPARPQFALHFTVPPQPSDTEPAHWFDGQGSGLGTQVQTLLVHVSGGVQLPQLSVPPQPLEMLPQSLS